MLGGAACIRGSGCRWGGGVEVICHPPFEVGLFRCGVIHSRVGGHGGGARAGESITSAGAEPAGVVPTEAVLEEDLQGYGQGTSLFQGERPLHEWGWGGRIWDWNELLRGPLARDGLGVILLPQVECEEFRRNRGWGCDGMVLRGDSYLIQSAVLPWGARPVTGECSGVWTWT